MEVHGGQHPCVLEKEGHMSVYMHLKCMGRVEVHPTFMTAPSSQRERSCLPAGWTKGSALVCNGLLS